MLLLIVLLINTSFAADSWTSNGSPSHERYISEISCRKQEEGPCFNVAECPLSYCEVVDGALRVNHALKDAIHAASIQEKEEKETRLQVQKAKKAAAKKELSEIDWSQVTTIAKCKQILKAIVDKLEDAE